MKFWKPILFTFVVFAALVSSIVYSSCQQQDNCQNVTCANGGSCRSGLCNCPTGFEGPTCADTASSRYLGYYAGYVICNNGAQVIDTVFIFPSNLTHVFLVEKNNPYDTLYGTVSNTPSTYDILIASVADSNFSEQFNATLQSDNTLVYNTYTRDLRTPGDTVSNKCNFLGTKHSLVGYY